MPQIATDDWVEAHLKSGYLISSCYLHCIWAGVCATGARASVRAVPPRPWMSAGGAVVRTGAMLAHRDVVPWLHGESCVLGGER